MNRTKNINRIWQPLLALAVMLCCITAEAQVRFNQSVPMSVRHAELMVADRSGGIPDVDQRVISLSSELKMKQANLPKNAVALSVESSWGLANAGSWQDLGDLGRLWRLEISSEDASSLNFVFSQFVLPEGASLTIYNTDQSLIMGPFTSAHNKPYKRFSTHLFYGSSAILEYFEPADKRGEGQLQLERIGYGIQKDRESISMNNHSRSGGTTKPRVTTPDVSCTVDANCPEGDGLDPMKRAVCEVLSYDDQSASWNQGTGTLINNGDEDCQPLILTAGQNIPQTANDPLNDDLIFRFNYIRTWCAGSAVDWDEVIDYCGADWILNLENGSTAPDIGVVRMQTPPVYKEYFAGWSNGDHWDTPGTFPTVRILGHPADNAMKVYLPKLTSWAQPDPVDASRDRWVMDAANGYLAYDGLWGAPFINKNLHVQAVSFQEDLHTCGENIIWANSIDYAWDFDDGDPSTPFLEDILNPNGVLPTINGTVTLDGRERFEMCGVVSRCVDGFVSPDFTAFVSNCEFLLTDVTTIPTGYSAVGREWTVNGVQQGFTIDNSLLIQGVPGQFNLVCLKVLIENDQTGEICTYELCESIGCNGQPQDPPSCLGATFDYPIIGFTIGENCNFTFYFDGSSDPNVEAIQWTIHGNTFWNEDPISYDFPPAGQFTYYAVCLKVYYRDPVSQELCVYQECRFINCYGQEQSWEVTTKRDEEVDLVYPNPVYLPNALLINHRAEGSGAIEIELLDMQGRSISKTLHAVSGGENQIRLETVEWPVGIYHLRMTQAGALIHAQQVIVLE